MHFLSWPTVLISLIGCIITVVIYRGFFHPLVGVPGPFLAKITTAYQSYYNRRYYKKIGELHEQYGPVICIAPGEVHLSDPGNYDKIYNVGSKYEKSGNLYNAVCIPHSSFSTLSNELHKHKRAMLNPMFSRRMVLNLEEVVQDKARKLVTLTERGVSDQEPIDLHHAFRCVSVDVITDYAFDKSYNLLDTSDLGAHFFAIARGIGPVLWAFQQVPQLVSIALTIPAWLAPILSTPLNQVLRLKGEGAKQIEDVKARIAAGKIGDSRPTIFSELLDPSKTDGWPVPTTDMLQDEAYSILVAAADTTGNAMTTAAFHVMSNAAIYAKLHIELEEAFPDPQAQLDFVTLERLPYLTGVIKESLRLSFGVIGRLSRVVPEPGECFNGYNLPAGNIVGMSSWTMHRDLEAFGPDPMTFNPERWMDPAKTRRLERYMVPFSRGTRQCVGMILAYCELYVTLGTFFRRFSGDRALTVWKTTARDFEYDDFFSSYQVNGRNWLKAIGLGVELA
ncbi:MAG: hypothetical protein M1820_002828 [Bogoriella megaspora]|nr:MAG: hypothetical protein M1820_002828 [Bogoriella megaspora]